MSGANGATEFKDVVGSLDELRALMGEPSEIALRKDIGRIDEHCRAFIARAPARGHRRPCGPLRRESQG